MPPYFDSFINNAETLNNDPLDHKANNIKQNFKKALLKNHSTSKKANSAKQLDYSNYINPSHAVQLSKFVPYSSLSFCRPILPSIEKAGVFSENIQM